MAPEVAAVERKGGYNQLCDIWACGITAIGKFNWVWQRGGGNMQYGLDITQLKTRFIICEYFRFFRFPQNWLNCSRPCSICIQCAPSSSCQRAASSRPHWATRINGARLFTISSRRPWPRIQRNVPQPNDCCSIRLSSARCRSEWPRSCCRSTRVPISIIIVSTVMRRWVQEGQERARARARAKGGQGQKPLATFMCNLFALLVLLCWWRVCWVVRGFGEKAWGAAVSANLARQVTYASWKFTLCAQQKLKI